VTLLEQRSGWVVDLLSLRAASEVDQDDDQRN